MTRNDHSSEQATFFMLRECAILIGVHPGKLSIEYLSREHY